ncbi:MAG: 2-hydroxychromene-2-carboxylate isomerase [Candidatus Phaeomarinobacter sp.]
MKQITFWYDFASTYSYLAALRVEEVASQHGVEVTWQPFLLGPIFGAQGWTDSPFNIYEAKGKYMWRDMARLAESFRLPFKRPDTFPQNSLLAGRVACLGQSEGWVADFTRAAYAAQFGEGRSIATADDLVPLLTGLDLDAADILARATAPDGKMALRQSTAAAIAAGVFGAPSFTTADGELFWGSDRLEQVVAWAATHGG